MKLEQTVHWIAWNIFLAVIPVVLAYVVYGLAKLSQKRLYLLFPTFIMALVWLAFLPNTCYLLTEWRHYLDTLDSSDLYLRSRGDSDLTLALMMHTVFYFFYSGIGMLTFTMAIRPVARIVRRTGISMWLMAIPFFIMLSLGVYLGLILRYNSWDLFTRPGLVWDSVTSLTYRPKLSAFIVAFGGFLWIAFIAIDAWIDGIKLKWRNVKE